MTHTYQITGMTCTSCEDKVKNALLLLQEISSVKVSKESNSAEITMNKHVSISQLQDVLGGKDSKYKISPLDHNESKEQVKSWFQTYKPIVLIFTLITIVTILAQSNSSEFDWMQGMSNFMAGFFLVFSFFKFLNLKEFAESYRMYDVIARKFPIWSYVYAFIELGLGLAFVSDFQPFAISIITLIVMSVSIIGVLQSVLNKRRIQCACLGAVFNLPMSSVTIIEDSLMIVMSAYMIFLMY